MREMKWTGYAVANHKECRDYSLYAAEGSNRLTYQVQEIIDVLEGTMNEKYYDLLIYYPGNGRIISGKYGSMDWGNYRSVYYGGETCEKQFQEILECNTKGAALYVMNPEGGEPLLCVAMRKIGDDIGDISTFDCVVLVEQQEETLSWKDTKMCIQLQKGKINIRNGGTYVSTNLSFHKNHRFHVKVTFDVGDQKYSVEINRIYPTVETVYKAENYDFRTNNREFEYVESLCVAKSFENCILWIENLKVNGKDLYTSESTQPEVPEGSETLEATLEEVYNGANGIVSMTFEDGYYDTAV